MVRRICLLSVLCLWSLALAAPGDDAGGQKKPAQERERPSPAPRAQSAEDREAQQKERDRRREEFNKLTPEQREAKRKELKARLEKRLNELRSKATNGGLSADEKRELTRREQILKRFNQP